MEGAFGKMRDQLGKMSSSCSHLVKIEHRISIEGTTMTAMKAPRNVLTSC